MCIFSFSADNSGEVNKLKAVILSYEKQVNELGDKVRTLQTEMEGKEKLSSQPPEKDKYKSLARRLKEERNQYKELVEEKKQEQEELKVEIEKMTDIIGDLRDNCGKLQDELLQVRLDSPRRTADKGIQTAPLPRRASIGGGETAGRAKITPKRTRSTVSATTPSPAPSPRTQQSQISRSIELSRPKVRHSVSAGPGTAPGSPAKGPRIVKPVQRSHSSSGVSTSASAPKCSPSPSPKPSPSHARSSQASRSSTPSKIPSLSKIPTPSKSRIPVKPGHSSSSRVQAATEFPDNDEVLFINEDGLATSDDSMEVSESRSPFPSRKLSERRESRDSSHTMEVESAQDEDDFPPPPIPEEAPEPEPEFPAPPAAADLEQLSMEAEMRDTVTTDPSITTPRTLRRADSMRQRVAARRIQRTWKHFYQEVSRWPEYSPGTAIV